MYNFKEIEKKWQNYWEEKETFKASNDSNKEKFYYLVEFPYPSGAGLHVGHVRSYTALDAMARKKRMQGYNVLYPIGWDAFGLPAEQYAIKNHIHPSKAVEENIKVFKGQIKSLGISFDWSREFSTTDPEYYKWTQWQFLKFYENGMAYKDKKEINWCPSCKIGLSNEESEGNVCERCGGPVVKKEKEQWMLRMSDYAERLLEGLDETEFVDRIKTAQINWIGKSIGAEVDFQLKEINESLKVFTTRPDTLFGATFMVISPEHKIISKYIDKIINIEDVKEYQEKAARKTEIERTDATKEKTGVKIDGLTAINPITGREIPIWISDYVLTNYGTGAIMAVPAHDERDYAFAKKFNIEIIPVIEGGDITKEAYTGDGIMINSGFLNGIDNKKDAIEKMLGYLEDKSIGKKKINYRLQDWVFSRQRFWGEPIPMVYCDECGWVPVNEEDLPVTLPDVASYEPTDDGESPLANITEWVNTTCPKCGHAARRETDTMPNWAGSSWYWLRYTDANNKNEFVSQEALKYWGMVDYYNGGMEHATRHLLYARFWHNFLYDKGLVPFKEPFKKRVAHGMILGSNGEKMSKSKGNVVNPDDMIKEYGADALRCYELFIGDYTADAAWNEDGLKGCKKFLDRIERIAEKLNGENEYSKSVEILINQTIKKVTEDFDNMKYNTAVSALMILLNEYEKLESISNKDYRVLLHLLNPIAPHITEELNEQYNLGLALCESTYPIYDEDKLINETFTMVVQVNGKVRGKIEVSSNTPKEDMEKKALEIDNVKKYLEGLEIVKVVTIPQKLVSIVAK
ncbi:MAG: leucine--tRNA ligase [Firmicutes bacterium]|nr:leucine--tRNA ligase [Bacillota bacterium]